MRYFHSIAPFSHKLYYHKRDFCKSRDFSGNSFRIFFSLLPIFNSFYYSGNFLVRYGNFSLSASRSNFFYIVSPSLTLCFLQCTENISFFCDILFAAVITILLTKFWLYISVGLWLQNLKNCDIVRYGNSSLSASRSNFFNIVSPSFTLCFLQYTKNISFFCDILFAAVINILLTKFWLYISVGFQDLKNVAVIMHLNDMPFIRTF